MNNTPTPRTDDGGRYCSHQRRERWIKTSPLKTSAELETELAAVIEQRDSLAEALQTIIRIYEKPDKGCIPCSSDMYDVAFQSLNQPTP